MMPFFSFDDDEFFGDLLLMGATAGGGKTVEDTATGNPLTFITDKAKPLKSLLIPFTPQQEGTGDPSPQNVRPIVPWDGVSVFGAGKNLLPNQKAIKANSIYLGVSEVESVDKETKSITLPAGTYTLSVETYDNTNTNLYVAKVGDADSIARETNTKSMTFTIEETLDLRIWAYKPNYSEIGTEAITSFQLEFGQTATAYEPYRPITETDISFPSPVYGGTLDVVSGVLTNKYNKIVVTKIRDILTSSGKRLWRTDLSVNGIPTTSLNRSNYFAEEYVSNVGAVEGNIYITGTSGNALIVVPYANQQELATKEEVEAWLAENPVVYCYPLATPQEITLTPAQITALVGDNTIWSDADGQMTAVYLKKG